MTAPVATQRKKTHDHPWNLLNAAAAGAYLVFLIGAIAKQQYGSAALALFGVLFFIALAWPEESK